MLRRRNHANPGALRNAPGFLRLRQAYRLSCSRRTGSASYENGALSEGRSQQAAKERASSINARPRPSQSLRDVPHNPGFLRLRQAYRLSCSRRTGSASYENGALSEGRSQQATKERASSIDARPRPSQSLRDVPHNLGFLRLRQAYRLSRSRRTGSPSYDVWRANSEARALLSPPPACGNGRVALFLTGGSLPRRHATDPPGRRAS
jgi:hypothetical protein